jgi:TonB family protein
VAMREPKAKLRPRLLISLVAFLLLGALSAATIPRLTVTLMSDPHGADLRPYLSQVQKTIAREWMRSWRPDWSSEGQVILRFSVDRSGKVLKRVIVSSSRLADLDRAVADVVTACSPFPPVPEAFHGDQMELHLKFVSR